MTGVLDVDSTLELPIGDTVAGTYTFFGVIATCAGGLSGTSEVFSHGVSGPSCGAPSEGRVVGQFCGTYSSGPYLGLAPPVLNGGACAGYIGGPGVWATSVEGRWSLAVVGVMAGWIDCGPDTFGAVTIVTAPIAPNTPPIPVVNDDGDALVEIDMSYLANNRACPDSGSPPYPIIGSGPEPQLWFCRMTMTGIAVLAG